MIYGGVILPVIGTGRWETEPHRKEGGQDCLDYMYITVFVRNAAILTVTNQGPKIQKWE
jgi:hypothetical protein